jgi:hypothetical protein
VYLQGVILVPELLLLGLCTCQGVVVVVVVVVQNGLFSAT